MQYFIFFTVLHLIATLIGVSLIVLGSFQIINIDFEFIGQILFIFYAIDISIRSLILMNMIKS